MDNYFQFDLADCRGDSYLGALSRRAAVSHGCFDRDNDSEPRINRRILSRGTSSSRAISRVSDSSARRDIYRQTPVFSGARIALANLDRTR